MSTYIKGPFLRKYTNGQYKTPREAHRRRNMVTASMKYQLDQSNFVAYPTYISIPLESGGGCGSLGSSSDWLGSYTNVSTIRGRN